MGQFQVHNGDVNNNITFKLQHQAESIGIKNKEKALLWLSPLEFENIHNQIRDDAGLEDRGNHESDDSDYTGKWLWDSTLFIQWLNQETRELWYIGMRKSNKACSRVLSSENIAAGAGKSTLASIIVERMMELRTRFNPSGRPGKIAYVYLRHDKNYLVDQILGSIIKQVVKSDKILPRSVTDLYTEFNGIEASRKKTRRFASIIHEISMDEAIYIVIDAVDEVERELANDLINLLRPKGKDSSYISLLVTSRIWSEFEHLSEGFSCALIKANNRDLDLFINYKFRSHSNLQRLEGNHSMIRDEVKKLIGWKCQEIFLLAKLQVQSLKLTDSSRSLSYIDLQNKLNELLPAGVGLDQMYSKVSNRMMEIKDKDTDTQRAYQILAWVVLSPRQLCVAELREFMSFDPIMKEFGDPAHQSTQDAIRDICDGLITFHNGKIFLVHYTTTVYFSQNADRLFGNFHSQIALSCATYLLAQDIEHTVNNNLERIDARLRRFPLLMYALEYLGYHLRKQVEGSVTETQQRVILLLETNSKRESLYQYIRALGLYHPSNQLRTPFFYHDVTHRWDMDDHRSGNSSLSGESGDGEDFPTTEYIDEFLGNLMEHLNLDSQCLQDEEDGAAVSNGNGMHSSDREAGDEVYTSTSSVEGLQTTIATVQDVISPPAEANPELPSEPSNIQLLAQLGRQTTPTHLAAWYGCIPILEHFLKNNKDVNTTDEFNQRPIEVALQQGHIDAVRVCVDYGAQIDLTSSGGQQIMLYISRRKDAKKSLVRSIIQQNHDRLDFLQQSDSHIVDYALKLPMFVACIALVCAMHLNTPLNRICRYMQHGDRIMSLYRRFNSDNILAAVARGDASTIARKITQGKWNVKDKSSRLGMMSIFVAVEFGGIDTVNALINGGVDVNIQDFDGNTPLIRASSRGNKDMVEALLNRNADVTLRNNSGRTAWTVNLEPENEKVLDILENHGGSNPDAYNKGDPVLYCHAAGGNLPLVQWLLNKGVNPSNRTIYGWAPLHWAASNGHIECVQALLRKGAEHSPLSDTSLTPLDLAMRQERTDIIQVLQEAGATRGKDYYDDIFDIFTPVGAYYECFDSFSYFSTEEEESSGSELSQILNANLDDEDVMYAQDGFVAVLLRLEQKVSVPADYKKKVMEFFFRDIAQVLRDLEYSSNEPNELIVSKSVSQRWDAIVQDLKQKKTISDILYITN
ncbi:hypothetical protein QQS21_004891 [Conoideocrella luteorostrata]|uniref:Nephrocystin 3-like N-terminal domain-containing protein n=1 Tax=Conoideocrella luteorostrata TaxID=1105319 RepID=A0AAJ0FUA5_9HYPO|nr:hypothetical protein QQS21_004891 [Conoideocrella luteorostrata]